MESQRDLLKSFIFAVKIVLMSKLPHVGTTIFTVMSAKANAFGAINLSQGFPDFPIDPELANCIRRSVDKNVHQYQPLSGYPLLLEKTGEIIFSQYARKLNLQEELLITAGATQAIYTTITALVSAGQEVIILDPAYDCYDAPVLLCGAKAVRVSLNKDYLPDWEMIEAACNARTKMIIINNPHNPSGKVWDQEDIIALENLLEKFPQMLVLSDEVYEFISYEKSHISLNTIESLRNRCIVVSSFGKTFHVTGWKIGYLVASEAIMREIKKVHQYLVFCVNSVAQDALANYISTEKVESLSEFYRSKRDYFQDLIKESRFEILPSEGTYFQLLDYSVISKEGDVEFCNRLISEFGVAAIPVSVFNADGKDNQRIRLCYAKKDETLLKAAEKLCRI